MAEWHQLSESEKSHANSAIDHYNGMSNQHKDNIAEAALHEIEDWVKKNWPVITTLGAAYVAKRIKRG